MLIERLELGELGTNCFLTADGSGGPLVVVDPAGEADVLLRAIGERPVSAVVLTHGHFDHLGAATVVVRETGAPLLVHTLDAPAVTDAWENGGLVFGYDRVGPKPDRLLEAGDVIESGELRLQVLHTPGHTPGSICLYVPAGPGGEPPHLFSGDTLFARSVGRTDFRGGDARALQASIRERLATLPAETRVHPGHGSDTSIEDEALANPFWPRGEGRST